MINQIKRTTQFKRDYKKAIKSGCKEKDFKEILKYLVEQKPLPDKCRDHALQDSKDYKNVRECHSLIEFLQNKWKHIDWLVFQFSLFHYVLLG